MADPRRRCPSASPSTTPSPTAKPSRAPHGRPKPADRATIDLSWIRYVVVGGLALLLLVWLVRTVPRRVLRIWRDLPDEDPDDPDDPAGPLSPEELAAAVAADRDAQLAAVQEGTPRNGVVAAWSRLEEIAAETGLAAPALGDLRGVHRADAGRAPGRRGRRPRARRRSTAGHASPPTS